MAPQNWTVILTGWFAVLARALAWLLVCSFCSLSFLGLGWFLLKIKSPTSRLLLLPFSWAIAELLRSYLYAIMSFGPGASFSPNFNWGALAVPAAGTPLVYASRLSGFFGLSLLVVAVNVCIYMLVTKRSIKYGAAGMITISLLTLVSWNIGNKPADTTARVALVHLNEKDDLVNWDSIPLPRENTELLVLPEYSNITKGDDFKRTAARLGDNGIGVTTDDVGLSPESVNQIQYFNNRAEVVDKQNKTFLIPTGEFIPYSLQFSFWLLGQQKITQDFRYTQQLTKGSVAEHPYNSGFSVGTLACSGVGALSEYNQLSDKGADILVNSASLSFLQEKSLYHVYARNMSRFHAVSNNKPFVQASRSGQSYIYDNQGNIVIEQRGNQSQLLEATIEL